MKIIVLLLIASFLGAKPVGEIVTVNGLAFIKKDKSNKFIKLKTGLKLDNGDLIKTTKGKVKVIFNDNSIIFIASRSKIRIDKYSYDRSTDSRDANLSLLSGRLKSWVSKLASKKRGFQIKTPTATIGVRGTQFIVEVKDKTTEVGVLEGSVAVKNLLDSTKTSILLTTNKFTKVIGKLPIEAKEMTPKYLKKIESGFNLENDLRININYSNFKKINLMNNSINKLRFNFQKVKLPKSIRTIMGTISFKNMLNNHKPSMKIWKKNDLDKEMKKNDKKIKDHVKKGR